MEYKQKNNSYEFNDIAKLAIKIVQDNSDVASELKNYYNEIIRIYE